jgi:hypothetical protein
MPTGPVSGAVGLGEGALFADFPVDAEFSFAEATGRDVNPAAAMTMMTGNQAR